jgi:hypothetical protein
MLKSVPCLLMTLFLPIVSFGQEAVTLTWEQLADVRFEETYDEATGSFYDKPVFGPMIQAMDGRKVRITGYVIPMDVNLNA